MAQVFEQHIQTVQVWLQQKLDRIATYHTPAVHTALNKEREIDRHVSVNDLLFYFNQDHTALVVNVFTMPPDVYASFNIIKVASLSYLKARTHFRFTIENLIDQPVKVFYILPYGREGDVYVP